MHIRSVYTEYPTTISIQACHIDAVREGTLEFDYVLDRDTKKIICRANNGLIRNTIREFHKNGHKFYVANYKPYTMKK